MSISTLQHLLSLLLYSLCNNQSGLKTKSKRRNDETFGCWNQNALCKNDNSDDQNCKVSRLMVWRWEAPSHSLLECMRQGCSFYSTWWEEIFETDSAFERNDLPFERSENMPWFDTDESWEQLSKSCCFLWKKVFVFVFFSWGPKITLWKSDIENRTDLQWYNLPVALLCSILCLSSWRYDLGMECRGWLQFCSGTTAYEREWESKIPSGS